MGASKKTQMGQLASDWPDAIWNAICAISDGRGAAWKLPAAALALTGARPASLEAGIVFHIVRDNGKTYLQATVPGVKLTENRGQPHYTLRWSADADTHRPQELRAIIEAALKAPDKRVVIQYDAEGISTKLRELSIRIWPRRKYKITAYCYRHLFSAAAKSAGADREELAKAMGHLSARSAGSYSRSRGKKGGGNKPWANVSAPKAVRPHKPLAQFKRKSAIKRNATPRPGG